MNKFILYYLAYIIFCVFSIIWSRNLGGAYTRIIDMIIAWFYLLALSSKCDNDALLTKCLDVFTFGVVFISIYSIVTDFSNLISWPRLGKKAFELAGQNQIYYSCVLIYSNLYSIYKIFTGKKNNKKYLFISIFLFICGLLTAIRKCFLIPLVFLICFVILNNKKNIIKLLFSGLVLTLVLLSAYFCVTKYFPSMSYRLTGMINDMTNNVDGSVGGNSYSNRKWLRQKAYEVFKDHPIIGVGVGQFRFYASDAGLNLYAHNNYLEILANTGICGFLIFYAIYISIIIDACKRRKEDDNNNIFIISFLIAMLIMEYGQVSYYQLNYLYFLCIFSSYLNQNKLLIIYNKFKIK